MAGLASTPSSVRRIQGIPFMFMGALKPLCAFQTAPGAHSTAPLEPSKSAKAVLHMYTSPRYFGLIAAAHSRAFLPLLRCVILTLWNPFTGLAY
eukprot:2273280-Pleurochrysis_carterae.AAC.2